MIPLLIRPEILFSSSEFSRIFAETDHSILVFVHITDNLIHLNLNTLHINFLHLPTILIRVFNYQFEQFDAIQIVIFIRIAHFEIIEFSITGRSVLLDINLVSVVLF